MNTPCLHPGERDSSHWRGRALGLIILLGAVGPACSVSAQDVAREVERSFQFIERLSQATDLFNAGKPGEALVIYQDLAAHSADLDEDGHAVVGVGDCFAALGQNDAARSAYAAASIAHPELQSSLASRLAEIDIAEASEEAIKRLEAAARSGSAIDLWRLGRGLQKRAEALLVEAGKAFRSASASGSVELLPGFMSRSLVGHVVVLEELLHDLSAIIEQTEATWSAPQRTANLMAKNVPAVTGPSFSTQRQKAEFLLQMQDGKRMEVQVHGESDGDALQVTVNGKAVELSETEKQLIQRHRDRINAILVEAAKRADGKSPEGK